MSVVNYTPGDPRYQRLAKVQLGVLYLRMLQYEEARRVFDELAALQDDEFKANGWAGIAVLAALQGDHQRSRQIIQTRFSTIEEHLDPESELAEFLNEADHRNHIDRQMTIGKPGQ